MRFAIVGLGSIGRRHLRNLLRLGQRDVILVRTFRSTLPDDELRPFPAVSSLEEALARGVDAVIVSNPTALHIPVALEAARAGVHLFLEKPIAHDWEGVETLRELVREKGLKVLVGFQFRFHPTLRQVKAWLEAGRIGRPLFLRAHWGEYLPDWHPWEDYRQSYAARKDLGGGVVRTLCHPLDYARFLLGDARVAWAYADHISDLDLQDVEDFGEIGLRFANGAVAAIHVDYFQRPPAHQLMVVGTEGTITWDYYQGLARWQRADGTTGEARVPEGWERNDMFLEEMAHFLEVLQGRAEPLCTLEDGIANLRLILDALAYTQKEKPAHAGNAPTGT